MLPQPTLSFTLPSLHDNTKLDCRIYHPACLDQPHGPPDPSWRRHASVVAHPYAPLGGCYDDPIVHLIASTLLRLDFVVATFNFRGASSSSGRTSWTSKPERADYMSVTGFLVYYMHYLSCPQLPLRSTAINENTPLPTLLLAGYSYGAMVTIQLPPLDSFLPYFASPATDTALADIRLRAQHLAEQQTLMWAGPSSPRKSLGMRIGGGEDTSLRKAHGKQRVNSPDREERIRRGVRDILSRHKLIHRRLSGNATDQAGESGHAVPCLESVGNLIKFRCAYLLVSPPLGVVTNLATMSFTNPLSSLSKLRRSGSGLSGNNESDAKRDEALGEADRKLTTNPTLALYGGQDSFLSLKKMRDWTSRLGGVERSQFYHVEVAGAGHFWVEEGVIYELREAIYSFAARVVGI